MYCHDGTPHQVVDPEDPSYDQSVLGRYDEAAGPRPNMLWSYCAKCQLGFRWSVHDQQWRPWPGGLSLLPHLSDEELDELLVAVIRRMDELGQVVGMAQNTASRTELHYKLRILMSLSTAVAEARYGLFPPEGPYEPRLWGEAWDTLGTWVDVQLAGIDRSSSNDMTDGAKAAFEAVRAEVGRMRASTSEDLLARRIAELETNRPEPGSADLS
jgi:hypothetical protein